MNHPIISAAELANRLGEVIVFDCRFSLADPEQPLARFQAARIPGAQHLHLEYDLSGDKTGDSGRHPLPRRARFENRLRKAGVNADSDVVLYDDNRMAGAARAWWLLTHFGHARVRVLDGGFRHWQEAGYAIESGAAEPRPSGDIVLKTGNPAMIAGRAEIRAAIRSGTPAIVDSREASRFSGEEEPIDPVPGRIPGARNLVWQTATDESGMLLGPDAQRARWRAVTADSDPIVYCGSGVTASVNLLSRKLAGLSGGRLYPGSWSEWCAHADCPIERD